MFEYRHVRLEKVANILPILNRLGKEGWEVICREPDDIGASYCYLLKRSTNHGGITVSLDGLSPMPQDTHAANTDSKPADADAAAAQRTDLRLVPRQPPDTRIPWAERALGPREQLYEPHKEEDANAQGC